LGTTKEIAKSRGMNKNYVDLQLSKYRCGLWTLECPKTFWESSSSCYFIKMIGCNWVPVVHACNPSYLGGRDQEDPGSSQPGANTSGDSILKIPNTK
jgi:hypothetical protein